MKNIALRLRYDGSRYHGWQVQKNAITVAQTMEEALAKVCGERVKRHRLRQDGRGRPRAALRARISTATAPCRSTVCRSR